MSEGHALLVDTADRLFASLGKDLGIAAAWSHVEEVGLSGLLVGEDAGGFGGDTCCRPGGGQGSSGRTRPGIWWLAALRNQ